MYSAMAGVSRFKNGGSGNPMGKPAYSMWPLRHGGRFGKKPVIATKSNSIGIASVIGHWPTSLP